MYGRFHGLLLYVDSKVLLSEFQVTNETRPLFLDGLRCSGLEKSLLECSSFYPLGLSECGHDQDVTVKCKGSSHGTLLACLDTEGDLSNLL